MRLAPSRLRSRWMTGRDRSPMNPRRNCIFIYCVALSATLALSSDVLAEGDSKTSQSHVMDSSNDRTPLITAFPGYPRIARRDRIEGNAIVCFKIGLDGVIRSIRVKSYSDRIFRRPVIRAIKASSFEPLLPHEIYSTSRTCRTYRFRLEPVVLASD
jgi:TonB family protein